MRKTTEQLAKECGFEFNTGLLMSYAPTHAQMEAFRLAFIRDYFENAEPACEMKDSFYHEGAIVPVVATSLPVGTKLYAAPKE